MIVALTSDEAGPTLNRSDNVTVVMTS